jgi:hypothetical protein
MTYINRVEALYLGCRANVRDGVTKWHIVPGLKSAFSAPAWAFRSAVNTSSNLNLTLSQDICTKVINIGKVSKN